MKALEPIKRRLAEKVRTKLAAREEVDLSIFRKRPSTRMLMGLGMMGLSYITCWPVIAVLGVLAFKLREQLIFSIGSPVAYGFSHLLFIAGAFVAGADGVMYSRVLLKWLSCKVYRKLWAESVPSPMRADSSPQVLETKE